MKTKDKEKVQVTCKRRNDEKGNGLGDEEHTRHAKGD